MTKVITLALLAALVPLPAIAQSTSTSVNRMAVRIGSLAKLSGKSYAPDQGVKPLDAKDPLKPVTLQYMNSTVDKADVRKSLSLQTAVDWNGDGIPDVAQMVQNRTQLAIMVRLGGGKGTVIAYRSVGQWGGASEVLAAGKRRLLVNFPESSVVVLSAESGQPRAYYLGD